MRSRAVLYSERTHCILTSLSLPQKVLLGTFKVRYGTARERIIHAVSTVFYVRSNLEFASAALLFYQINTRSLRKE